MRGGHAVPGRHRGTPRRRCSASPESRKSVSDMLSGHDDNGRDHIGDRSTRTGTSARQTTAASPDRSFQTAIGLRARGWIRIRKRWPLRVAKSSAPETRAVTRPGSGRRGRVASCRREIPRSTGHQPGRPREPPRHMTSVAAAVSIVAARGPDLSPAPRHRLALPDSVHNNRQSPQAPMIIGRPAIPEASQHIPTTDGSRARPTRPAQPFHDRRPIPIARDRGVLGPIESRPDNHHRCAAVFGRDAGVTAPLEPDRSHDDSDAPTVSQLPDTGRAAR